MSSSYGENFRISIFGESHAAAIGVTMEGLPAGSPIDSGTLKAFLERRAPGRDKLSTSRREADAPEFLCGVKDSVATGAPIAAVIRNSDTRPQDYAGLANVPRPGHADLPAEVMRFQRSYLDRALCLCEEDPDFRWTIESARLLKDYIAHRPEADVERIMALLRRGQMELMGFDCRLSYEDYHTFYRDNYNQWAADHIQKAEK